jgi:hypothetical protein
LNVCRKVVEDTSGNVTPVNGELDEVVNELALDRLAPAQREEAVLARLRQCGFNDVLVGHEDNNVGEVIRASLARFGRYTGTAVHRENDAR